MVLAEDWPSEGGSPVFINRRQELEWLFERYKDGRSPVVISGSPGVGKTTLLKHFLTDVRTSPKPTVFSPRYALGDPFIEIIAAADEFQRGRSAPQIVAIDDAEIFGSEQLETISNRLLNLKRVRMVIFVTRQMPEITRAHVLTLHPLAPRDARQLLERILDEDFTPENMSRALEASAGSPLVLRMLAEITRGCDPEQIRRLLSGELYSLGWPIVGGKKEFIAQIKPKIIFANEILIEKIRKQPDSIYELSPRGFEELVAELLSDMGYEVELTPATRDGGKDILAFMNAPLGKFLCLVEAKKHRPDRPVSVGLVRQLYGTLADADATSAMLVTTSTFSPDAKAFEGRHQYKLTLRDYGNVVRWIEDYRGSRSA